jgi:hypothetical protein
MRPTWNDPMYVNNRSGEQIHRCYFAVGNSLNLNQYQLILTEIWPSPQNPSPIKFDSSYYLMGTFLLQLLVYDGRGGVYSANLRLFATATGDVGDNATAQPTSIRLLQNFPNPFNPGTRISYELAQSCHVNLKVLNLLGQEIIALVDRFEPVGFHSVHLDMSGFTSGVYLCKLQAGKTSRISKLVLLR